MPKMKGFIYIAGSFETVNRSKCGRGKGWIDNDPHFWDDPPTWEICRNDLRRKAGNGDHIFFVLPKHARHPQMVFGYMRIAEEIITHVEAFDRADLAKKRMQNKNPNGNIIVNIRGAYNKFNYGAHEGIFHKIKTRYAVGDPHTSLFLNDRQIRALAPGFIKILKDVLGGSGSRPIDFISRYGRELTESQAKRFLSWLRDGVKSTASE